MMKNIVKEKYVFILAFIAVIYIVFALFRSMISFSVLFEDYQDWLLYSSNILFHVLTFTLILKMIIVLYPTSEENNDIIKPLLMFLTVLMLFSRIQEVNMTWGAKDQLSVFYFFTLLAFFYSVKFLSQHKQYIRIGTLLVAVVSATMILGSYNGTLSPHIAQNAVGMGTGEFARYFLSYLGGIFYYVSGKECLSLAIMAGVALLGSILYMSYLIFVRKVFNDYYLIIWAYLLSYIGSAILTVRYELSLEIHHLYKHQYITFSLISWNLLFIFYVHMSKNNKKILEKFFMLGVTLIIFLLGYQFNDNKIMQDDSYKKAAVLALEMELKDPQTVSSLLKNVDASLQEIERESIFDQKDVNWNAIVDHSLVLIQDNISTAIYVEIQNLVDKIASEIEELPQKDLVGYLEKSVYISHPKHALRIHGWIFDTNQKRVPQLLYATNEKNKILGYIFTGIYRGDVRKVHGKRALNSGFIGYIIDNKKIDRLYLVDVEQKKKMEIKLPK